MHSSARPSQLAWLPVPLLTLAIACLWIADLRAVYESRALMVLLNVLFTWLASLCICILTARGFLGSGQPGLLMFGCGSLLWGVTSLVAAVMVDRVNPTITVHNLGVCGAAFCHLAGLLWRGRLTRTGPWLLAGYAGALMSAALIVWAATAGLTPVFFVQGQGGTPIRQVVLLLAITMFAWVAWQLIGRFRRQAGAFYYWYGLGLALVATGLTGVMLLSVQGGILGWTNRLTQYLGSAYLFIAALLAARETGRLTFSLPAVEEAREEASFLAGFRERTPLGWTLRYGVAVVAVAAALGFREAVAVWFGPGLPAYITFYPAVMVVALLGGFGPGLVATALAGFAATYWILPPAGQMAIASPLDRLGLVIFATMGAFMTGVAELARRHRHKAAAYDREAALRESQARLAAFAEATFEGIVESDAGRIMDCNEQFARMIGYSAAELRGMEIPSLGAPEARDQVMANIREARESSIEHAMFRRDGTRIVVEVHGRPVSPGSARRLTAIRDITERKRAEEAVRHSEMLLRAVTDNSPDPIFLKDADSRMLLANPATLAVLQKRAEEVLGKTDEEFYDDPAIGRRMVANDRRVMESGQTQVMEEVVPSPGRTRTFLSAKSPYRDADGRIIGVIGVARDITDRKEAEEALRKSRERLDLALVSARMASFDWDIVGNKRIWSDGVHALLGTQPETFTGAAGEFFQAIHPEDQSAVQAALVRAVETTSAYETEYRAVWPDGSVHHIAARGKVHRDDAGRAVQMTGVCWDVTERKQAAEALRVNDERYRKLFNTVDAGFCIIEMVFDAAAKPVDYRFLEVNAAFERQTGLRDAQGKSMRELVPAHEAHWYETYGKIALTGEAAHFVNEAKALNRWYDVYAYRVGAPESRQVAILFNDITAHKQAEAEIRRRAEDLRAANEELTRFNRITVGRELRIIELKQQVNELCARLGQSPRYEAELDKEARPTP